MNSPKGRTSHHRFIPAPAGNAQRFQRIPCSDTVHPRACGERGLVFLNPDDPKRPRNSPKNVYQLEPSAFALLQGFETKQWDTNLAAYLKSMRGVNRLREKARQMERIPVVLPDGQELNLTAGGQNVLVKEIIDQFAPRFTPGGYVIYVGDAGEKHLFYGMDYLKRLGVEIDPHGKMPDVVIHHVERD